MLALAALGDGKGISRRSPRAFARDKIGPRVGKVGHVGDVSRECPVVVGQDGQNPAHGVNMGKLPVGVENLRLHEEVLHKGSKAFAAQGRVIIRVGNVFVVGRALSPT